MEQVLQKNVKIGHVSNSKWLEQPKIDPKEVATFHSGEKNELEDVTKNNKPKNHPPKLRCIKTKPKTPWEPIWDPTKKKKFWYHQIVVTSPHARKSEIDQLHKQIDELSQFSRKEAYDEVRSV